MGGNEQNHGLVFFMYLNRLIQLKHAQCDNLDSPRILLLDSFASGVFIFGRDVHDQPYIAVPSAMIPYFTEVDWSEASILRKAGYLFLEARDPETQMLLMAFGIRVRSRRLDAICVAGQEDVADLRLSIKIFEQDPGNPRSVIFSDRNEIVGITLKEINSLDELGSEFDDEYARSLLERSGVDNTFTAIELGGLNRE